MSKRGLILLAGVSYAFLLALLAASVEQSATTHAQDSRYVWEAVAGTPSDVDFESVFLTNERNAWLAGSRGTEGVVYAAVWVGDGQFKTLELSPESKFRFRAPVRAIVSVGQGGDNLWVVGEQGLIAHRSGSIWSEVANPVPDATLLKVQMLGDGSEGWAAGYRNPSPTGNIEAVLLHYRNGSWERDNSIAGPFAINGLHFAPGGGWAVGQTGIWRYRNGAWSPEQEPQPCAEVGCYQYYNDVRAVSQDEAWIVGSRAATCGICVSQPYIIHRTGGSWQRMVPDTPIVGDPNGPQTGYEVRSTTFTDPSNGIAVGVTGSTEEPHPLVLMYHQGRWVYATTRATNGTLNSVSAIDAEHALAVGNNGAVMSYGYGPQPLPSVTPTRTLTPYPPALGTYIAGLTPTATVTPQGGANQTQRVADPHDPNITYFSLVGHTLRSGFGTYWRVHGGLPQFGYPLTEEYREVSPTDGKVYAVQYFERARFEYHPENKPPYDVLLGLLGHTIAANRKQEAPFLPTASQANKPGVVFFKETNHNMPPQFVDYWRIHGGLPVYGYPISEAFIEQSPTDGKSYLVQYFERNRFEYHPELPAEYRVSLGLLGVEVLKGRGWIAR